MRQNWSTCAILHVRRVKQGTPATHPLTGREFAGLAPAPTAGGGLTFCFCQRACGSVFDAGLSSNDRTRVPQRRSRLRYTHTCCATPAGTSWQTIALIPARSRAIWDTNRSSIRCAIPIWPRRASKICLEISEIGTTFFLDPTMVCTVRATPAGNPPAATAGRGTVSFSLGQFFNYKRTENQIFR